MKFADVQEAQARLENIIHHIPAEHSTTFSRITGSNLYLKPENRQKTGSFKVRGAYNKIAILKAKGSLQHAITSSAGNHAQGVAFACKKLNVPGTIVMPRTAPIAKIEATKHYGAEIVLAGNNYDEAYIKALEIQKEKGATFIHPFDDTDVIAGQGTLGLEILKDVPVADLVFVPVGGGGLIAGISYCIKQINPRIKIIGVQASGADAIVQSFKHKIFTSTETSRTICDGIAVKIPGKKTLSLINKYVDEMITVNDSEVSAVILMLIERLKTVVEPSGAASLAGALSKKIDVSGKNVVCLLSGGNIDVSFIHKIIERGLIKRGRLICFDTVMNDVPGQQEKFSRITAGMSANIYSFQHDRLNSVIGLDETIVRVAVEVSGPEHGLALIEALEKEGFRITVTSCSI